MHGIDTSAPIPAWALTQSLQAQKNVDAYMASHHIHHAQPLVLCPDGTCGYYNKTLGVTAHVQNQWYYCGPASASEILSFVGKSYSQDDLANRMGTTPQQGTDPTKLASTLNSLTPPGYAWVNLYSGNYSTVSAYSPDWWNDMYYSIFTRGRPADEAVHFTGNGETLIGWNYNNQAWHFVTADGMLYNLGGTSDHYVDSYNGYTSSFGPHWINETTLMDVSYYGRGLIWGQE